jgi:hypothetical protein
MSFLKKEGQEGKTVERRGHKQRIKESKHGGSTVYSFMKMEQ